MKLNVIFSEFTIYKRIFPLASAYIQSYASKDREIANNCTFSHYCTHVETEAKTIFTELLNRQSDVYAFSCYMWNIGLVKKVLEGLLETRQDAYFILGGPQVIHQAEDFLPFGHENLYICNGEGEITFAEFLKEVASENPDFSRVRGLSYFRDGQVVTTQDQYRIINLDEIPSPFIDNNLFDKQLYNYTVFETNRGCPYDCAYCFYGGIGRKVHKFSEDRVKAELTWLCKNRLTGLLLADANWGMFARDEEITEHIAKLKKKYDCPYIIISNTAKNDPDRMFRISGILQNAGLMSPHTISIQSLHSPTLDIIGRKNMAVNSYQELQTGLNAKNISSYIELIWPLPGETIESFRNGINLLCEFGTESIFAYPFVLLKNTKLHRNRLQHGFNTKRVIDGHSETDLVIKTGEVSRSDYQEGLWLNFALIVLYNSRTLFSLANYLNKAKGVSFSELFDRFSNFCQLNNDVNLVGFHEEAIQNLSYYDFVYCGKLLHLALHADREQLSHYLYRFISSQQDWWDDMNARVCFEYDLLNRPYVYSNTPSKTPEYNFEHIMITQESPYLFEVKVSDTFLDVLEHRLDFVKSRSGSNHTFIINYKRKQLPYMRGKSLDENAGYCNGMMLNIGNIMPKWTQLAQDKS